MAEEREILPGVYVTDFRRSGGAAEVGARDAKDSKTPAKSKAAEVKASLAAAAAVPLPDGELDTAEAALLKALDLTSPMDRATKELLEHAARGAAAGHYGGFGADINAVQQHVKELTRLRAKLLESNAEMLQFMQSGDDDDDATPASAAAATTAGPKAVGPPSSAKANAPDPDLVLAIDENNAVVKRYDAQIRVLNALIARATAAASSSSSGGAAAKPKAAPAAAAAPATTTVTPAAAAVAPAAAASPAAAAPAASNASGSGNGSGHSADDGEGGLYL